MINAPDVIARMIEEWRSIKSPNWRPYADCADELSRLREKVILPMAEALREMLAASEYGKGSGPKMVAARAKVRAVLAAFAGADAREGRDEG